MQTKLTLRMDAALISRAKEHARRSGKSLSRLVAEYLSLLDGDQDDTTALPPTVRSLKGALRDASTDREDYLRHLEEEYL